MFPPQFEYRRATSVEEALSLLSNETDSRVLAGGHALIPEMKTGQTAPDQLIDVSEIDALYGIDVEDEHTRIGALTTYADLVDEPSLREHATVVAEAAESVGDLQIRNRGTIGGNLAQADPDGDLPGAAIAADATILVRDVNGTQAVEADEFLSEDGPAGVGRQSLVTAVKIPHAPASGGAYVKKDHPATGYAMVGVAAVVGVTDDSITGARIAANGVSKQAVRLRTVEESLVGRPPTVEVVEEAASAAGDGLDQNAIPSDPYASGAFRASLLVRYTARAVRTALERTDDGARLLGDGGRTQSDTGGDGS